MKFTIQTRNYHGFLNNLILFILLILSFQYVAFFYIENKTLSRLFLYVFYGIAFILPAILMYRRKTNQNNYRDFFLISLFPITILTLTNFSEDIPQTVASISIYIQILSAFFFTRFDIDYIEKSFIQLAILSIIAATYIIFKTDIDVASAIKRGYQYTEIFYFPSLFWGVTPFVILSILRNKNLLISTAYWAVSIALNLIIIKRFIIIDSALLLIIIITINLLRKGKIKTFSKTFVIGIIFISLGLIYAGDILLNLLENVTTRIRITSEDLSSFDRLVESKNYLNSTNLFFLIFGKGVGGTHTGLDTISQALHIGWINFILKGGIILLILILIPYFKMIRIAKYLKNTPIKIQFSFWFLLISIFRLSYNNMHSLAPEMLIFFYCIFTIMDYKYIKK